MKRFYLIRHAEAAPATAGINDVNRKLVPVGEINAQKAARYFQQQKVRFDCIISSHALRALETARLIAKSQEYPEKNILIDKRLYINDASLIFDVLFEQAESLTDIAIVGHNPCISEFANYFLQEQIAGMPPSGVVCIEFATDKWIDINLVSHKKLFIFYP
jgi:phosphohistidine phosphatase